MRIFPDNICVAAERVGAWESSEFKVFLSAEETAGRATINMLFATRRELERTASKLPEVFSTVIWVEPPPSRFTAVTQPCEIR